MRKKKFRWRKPGGINPSRLERGQIKFYLYLIPIAAFMTIPILFIVANAFKPVDELFAYPPRPYVKHPTFENFRQLFSISGTTSVPASRYLLNSIVITVVAVFASVYISAAVGYVFSKKRFRGRDKLFSINTVALMFVPVAVAIPRYFVVVYLGLHDNFLAHILPILAMPVGVFLIKQFVDQLPSALIEAAVLDGASDFKILHKVIIPLTKPALATVAIQMFQTAWNSVEASSYYIDTESLKNFSFYMTTLSNTAGNSVAGQGVSAAATLLMFLPNLILFIILQSRVMNTMAHSGIK